MVFLGVSKQMELQGDIQLVELIPQQSPYSVNNEVI